ncbi:uncharacterized protein LOC133479613 isoform X2 [Phyllopteryx taeniolatus]|uniref:uncharacterized protein LOC133479613 isoform X2 n=1 Tax=Phyllopteryx taeniolatus TaxID=161469 RepID=UPI002AD3C23A|nr:uncharacterized protein LOC133479613 isoform X2 [Phyllopteryx taeniolatus]
MNIRTMRKTFVCDDSTIITICLGKDSEGRGLAMMPREFSCVFQDMFKVFAYNGFPKPLGAAQCLAGVLIITLNLMIHQGYINMLLIFPSILFVLCGILTYVAGHVPNMCVTKVAFCLNIISFLCSAVSLCLSVLDLHSFQRLTSSELKLHTGIKATIVCLLAMESFITLFLIYWQSKAVCRQHFNTLPIVQLKQED